jgi:hypothetical protein
MNTNRFNTGIYILLLCGTFGVVGCAPKYEVPDDLQPYVDRFAAENKTRGLTLEINDLIISLGEVKSEEAWGECVSGSFQKPPEIRIDRGFWYDEAHLFVDRKNDLDAIRENVLFHELGHCILHEDHQEWGIMRNSPYGPTQYISERSMFLDELVRVALAAQGD